MPSFSLARAQRYVEFARHMPLDKLARRLQLDVRRRLRDRLLPWPAAEQAASPPLAPAPPQPIFAARRHLAPSVSADGLRFAFLGRTHQMTGGQVDWRAPGPGPANQLWCMNLHYMEYLEAVDDDHWQRLLGDWIDNNPPSRPGVWRDAWNSYALSLRVVVWMQQLAARRDLSDPALRRRMVDSLSQQLRFLEANLETDIGGNHLVKNIKALLWASAFFTGAEAERWRALGLRLLDREIDHQILPDGMHDERSASYHAQVFADLLECRHALGHDPFAGRLDETLHRMAQVTADLAHPDGGPVLFNDAGLSMAYGPAECLAVYERLMARRPTPRALFALPDAGYFALRSADSYFIADCGRIAPDDLPAHGHGDVLSFEWSVAGRRIIVDQGVFEYSAGPHRQRARAAASHNTLTLDGADQADFFGAFRCGRRPNVEVRDWQPMDGGFVLEGAHDGFRHLPGRPIHVRRFEVGQDRLVIHDRIDGATDRTATLGFLLHPDVVVETNGDAATLVCGDVAITMTAPAVVAIEPAVWWPDMGREIATRRLVVRLTAADPQPWITRFAVTRGAKPQPNGQSQA